MILALAFACLVTSVHDGDTWRCQSGTKVRAAGIDANELDGTCHTTCATMPACRSQAYVSTLILGRTLSCQPADRSYRRIVARCRLPGGRDLACTEIAAGAAVRWDRYWTRYGMGRCR